MFSPVPMRQMRVVIMERDKRTVLQGLGKLGVMHLTHHSPGDKEEGSLLQPVDRTVERERCRALLARINDVRHVERAEIRRARQRARAARRGDRAALHVDAGQKVGIDVGEPLRLMAGEAEVLAHAVDRHVDAA